MNPISFAGRVAIVTGSGRGIGRGYALDLARRGAKVVVNDVGLDEATGFSRADAVVQEIRAAGGEAAASTADVSTIAGGKALTELALSAFGGIDIVINNAGFLRRGMFDDVSLEHVREILDVHLLGAFHVTQPAWKVMKEKGYGRVVLTSSGATFGMQGNSNYVAAKAGLLGLTSALALEGEASGIRVNAILPFARSLITADSPATAIAAPDAVRNVAIQTELGERATVEAVGAATLYLASDQCHLSGEAISAVAGRYARTFSVVTKGWLCPDVTGVSPEAVRDHIAEVTETPAVEMRSMTEEFGSVLDRVRAQH